MTEYRLRVIGVLYVYVGHLHKHLFRTICQRMFIGQSYWCENITILNSNTYTTSMCCLRVMQLEYGDSVNGSNVIIHAWNRWILHKF